MKAKSFRDFSRLRDEFESRVRSWNDSAPWLGELQEELRGQLGYDDYRVETPIVFNEALSALDESADPAFILVADNPGKKEQLAMNRRYLVGQSGKLAEGWFGRELGVDFRRDVLLINKTPIHTPKTAELRKLLVLAGARGPGLRSELAALLDDSQRWMARMAKALHRIFEVPLWISGYGELGQRGLFAPYARALAEEYLDAPAAMRDTVLLFRHFSMNQFSIEMRQKRDPSRPIGEELVRIGSANRRRVLGW